MTFIPSLQLIKPEHWKSYELIDSGGGEKLERFGTYITIRPEPQALWEKKLTDKEWMAKAHVKFEQKGSHNGQWTRIKQMPDKWNLVYESPFLSLTFNLSFTSFNEVGFKGFIGISIPGTLSLTN
jgi:23S rRNA (cytosine1962-C5)-methyltransferase